MQDVEPEVYGRGNLIHILTAGPLGSYLRNLDFPVCQFDGIG